MKHLEEVIINYDKKLMKANKEIERLNNIINNFDKLLIEHIDECREELNIIMYGEDLDYINQCSREFEVIRKNIEMIMAKFKVLKDSDSNGQ